MMQDIEDLRILKKENTLEPPPQDWKIRLRFREVRLFSSPQL